MDNGYPVHGRVDGGHSRKDPWDENRPVWRPNSGPYGNGQNSHKPTSQLRPPIPWPGRQYGQQPSALPNPNEGKCSYNQNIHFILSRLTSAFALLYYY